MKLILDEAKCTGCKICELACSAKHQGVFNPGKSHLKIIDAGTIKGAKKQLNSCTLCLNCVSSCPAGAITFNNNWLVMAQESCSGCGICVDVCPQKIIHLNNEGKAAIPDFCQGNPACVEWCPHQALLKEETLK